MPWLRVDDGMWRNRKLLPVSPIGKALYTWCLGYSSDQLTDGRLSPTDLRQIAAAVGLTDWAEPMNELIAAGLVEFDGKTFTVHDYLEYNPSRAQVQAERDAARKRMFALRSGEHSQNVIHPVPGPVPVPVPSSSSSLPPQPKTEPDPVVDRLVSYGITYMTANKLAAGRDAFCVAWMDYADRQTGIPNLPAFLTGNIQAGQPPPPEPPRTGPRSAQTSGGCHVRTRTDRRDSGAERIMPAAAEVQRDVNGEPIPVLSAEQLASIAGMSRVPGRRLAVGPGPPAAGAM